MDIVAEVPGYIQIFSDGTVKRFDHRAGTSPPDTSNAAFEFHDVVVDESKPITARIFVPGVVGEGRRSLLPIIAYFHGGGFCFGTTTWPSYTSFLGELCVRCRCIVISVDYRLAPEHRLPTAYEDCYASLVWMALNGAQWLEKADMSRVFLSGESAGGNIVHLLALRVLRSPIEHLKVVGLVIIHPFFGGRVRLEEENSCEDRGVVDATDTLWRLSLPEGADRDHPFSNFAGSIGADDEWKEFPKTIIFLAGKDLLKARGAAYGAFLKSKGAREVTAVIAEEEVHAYHVFFPFSDATKLLRSQIAEFMD
ncbi:putative carboxylesterase 17 [Wolffia australiana]